MLAEGRESAHDNALATLQQLQKRRLVERAERVVHEQAVERGGDRLPQRVLLALVAARELLRAVQAEVAVARDGQHDELLGVRVQPMPNVSQVLGEREHCFNEVQPHPLMRADVRPPLRARAGGWAAERAAEVEKAYPGVELLPNAQSLRDSHGLDEVADEGDGRADKVVQERGEGGGDVVGVVGDAVAEVESERVVGAGQLQVKDSEVADDGEEARHPGRKGSGWRGAVGSSGESGLSAHEEEQEKQNINAHRQGILHRTAAV